MLDILGVIRGTILGSFNKKMLDQNAALANWV